jgi:predicted enzyme related to lactoylglutathione lyase
MTTNSGGTAMLEKIFYSSVLVSDQDRALDFYTNVLGLEKRAENPTPDGPRFLTVGVKGQDFMLVLWPGTPGQAQPVQGGIPASVTIETDDIRKTHEELWSSIRTCSSSPGATSRNSWTRTATGCRSEKAASNAAIAIRARPGCSFHAREPSLLECRFAREGRADEDGRTGEKEKLQLTGVRWPSRPSDPAVDHVGRRASALRESRVAPERIGARYGTS